MTESQFEGDMMVKFFLHQFARLVAVGWMLVVFATFFDAYNNPDKISCISINSLGEANLELALLSVGIPMVVAFLIGDVLNDLRALKKQQAL